MGRDKKKVAASLDSAGVLCPGVTVGDLLEDGSSEKVFMNAVQRKLVGLNQITRKPKPKMSSAAPANIRGPHA